MLIVSFLKYNERQGFDIDNEVFPIISVITNQKRDVKQLFGHMKNCFIDYVIILN